MSKFKKWFAILGVVIILTSIFTFITPASEANAESYRCPPTTNNIGNGILSYGENCDSTPSVWVGHGKYIKYSVINRSGNRTIHARFVPSYSYFNEVLYNIGYIYPRDSHWNEATGTIYHEGYGWISLQMRCTSGRTIYNDCDASARFEIVK
ncbi:hypothetical protein BG07_4076 [Bacillus pseudomycoides]|uniref:hypothetical protein n=1 Tax=Bacillus TaxID=1386 RepID=UPI000367911B|nr:MULTISPECIES: hypothetical protein [Bacillus]AIK37468.1 hypothetical protein DJ92_859 [Bacillus pseudomycoides]AJI15659.1 hypothetical protein BG07_4076 [Bacillus pseudomycoides]MEB3054468.1 hypothetical protein [Bacillus pseudomycoides]PDY47681.1 hypothetical protein CON79_08945 [Bacillus pseudomycoides]PGC30196.1 hypothetical protein COM11_11440 [Bacillus pseudomycoides]